MNASGSLATLFAQKQEEIYYSIEDYLFDVENAEVTAQFLDVII